MPPFLPSIGYGGNSLLEQSALPRVTVADVLKFAGAALILMMIFKKIR